MQKVLVKQFSYNMRILVADRKILDKRLKHEALAAGMENYVQGALLRT